MGGRLNTTTGKWRSDAERVRHNREVRKARDPAFLARERERVAAVRAGQPPAPRPAPPAPPGPHEAPSPANPPRTRVDAITDAWDARLHERRLRRAERRGTA